MGNLVIVVMGVSGSGKTSVGQLLATKLNIPFFDADDFHPKENVEKMSSGIALEDTDRAPWLDILNKEINNWQNTTGAILACSALKEKYRTTLSLSNQITWVVLNGSFELIQERIQKRSGHFMTSTLLESQFDTLELPSYGLLVDINNPIDKIINNIIIKIKHMKKSFFGVIGMGVMGRNIALNIAENGYSVSVYNRASHGEEKVVKDFLNEHISFENIQGHTEMADFTNSLESPKKILMMVKAGEVVDQVIENLVPLLEEGDIIIDGGNSHYLDTKRRNEQLQSKGLHFVGSGISGGEEGARKGPAIMPGGSPYSYSKISSVLEDIAAKDQNGKACCNYIGPDGAGHFVKMIHNGIEYAEMQLLAEIYDLLQASMSYEEISAVLEEWNNEDLSSYLLEITINILKHKNDEEYTLDTILDKAGNKGTGSWSSKAAFDYGSVNTMMSSAVFARYISSYKSERSNISKKLIIEENDIEEIDLEELASAYRFARILNHHQGFELMKHASAKYNWELDLKNICQTWTSGCIIRSNFMLDCVGYFDNTDNLLSIDDILAKLQNSESTSSAIIKYALDARIPIPTFSAAHQYWISISTNRLPANMIQAQRDYFGAHTYQRVDKSEDEFFHTNWITND